MKIVEVKKLVEYFEDKIVNNFETHFSHLVLDDFYGGGYRDRIEDEFFYDEYFEQYEENIINLLLEIENETSSEFMDFKLRLIKLKRIIDTRLVKLNFNNSNYTNSSPKRQTRINFFLLKDTINKEEFITLFYTELINKKFIDCSKEKFLQLFEDSKNKQKIQWRGTELQLTFIINSLLRYFDFDLNKKHYKLMATHFINRFGNHFKPDQLCSVYSDKCNNIEPKESIVELVNKIDTHFLHT